MKEVGVKLSVGSFGFTKEYIQEALIRNNKEDIPLVRFMGAAVGLKPYVNKYKKNDADPDRLYGLTGEFKGISSIGEEKEGGVLYLPGNVHSMVEAALSLGGDIESVRIAFDVYARWDADMATSYRYVTFDVLNEGSQSVAQIEEAVKAMPALPSLGGSEQKKLK